MSWRGLLGAVVFTPFVAFGTERLQLLTDNIVINNSQNSTVSFGQNSLLYSPTRLIKAKNSSLNTKTNILTLSDNVTLISQNTSILAAHAVLNTSNSNLNASEVFVFERENEIWMQAQSLCAHGNITLTTNSILSSCDASSPAWSVAFSRSKLDTQKQFLHLYNVVFYAHKAPIFYLPYFGFPTTNKRTTGFLYPDVSYKNSEGLRLVLPFYIAPQNWWDLQFDPQLRNRRGYGLGTTFRWVDSPEGFGEIRYGFFKEKDHYFQREGLLHHDHHGVEGRYTRQNVFSKWLNSAQEGLGFVGTWVKVIVFLNTKILKNVVVRLIVSRLNYFTAWQKDYLGLYGRYYIDTTKLANKNGNHDTLQELPTLHYHRHATPLSVQNEAWWQRVLGAFSYSFDAKAHNYARGIGVTARHYEADLPLRLNFNASRWVNVELKQRFYASHAEYNRRFNALCQSPNLCTTLVADKSEDYLRSYTEATLNSNLAKNYGFLLHTIDASFSFIQPGFKHGEFAPKLLKSHALSGTNYTRAGFWEENFIQGLEARYTTQNLFFEATNQFYLKDGSRILRHYLDQSFDLEESSFGNLRSKTELFLGGLTLKNAFEYSRELKQMQTYQNTLAFNSKFFTLSGTQTYQHRAGKTPDNENYFTSNLTVKIGRNVELSGGLDYDLTRSYKKSWNAGILAKFGCWQVGFNYTEDVKPRNTKTGVRANREEEFYLFFRFYPIGQAGYSHNIDHIYDN